MKTIIVTRKNFQSRMKAIETRTLKKYGTSLSWTSLYHYFNPCIIEICANEYLLIDEKKYKEISHKALNNNLDK